MKTPVAYWNSLHPEYQDRWTPLPGLEGQVEELTLSSDPATGEYTRLTRFLPGVDTTAFGGKVHAYPEEVFIVSGRLYDQAFDLWLEAGHYASRPPGERHGPFKTDVGCVVLEVSFPQRVVVEESRDPAMSQTTVVSGTSASTEKSENFPHDRQPTVRLLAMPAHTNPSGNIFGGWIMAQMDIAGGVVALEYAGGPVVTVAVTSMEFHKPVQVGDLVSCFARIQNVGSSSVTVKVQVFAQRAHNGILQSVQVTEAVIVYVAVNDHGTPRKLPERGADFGHYW